MTPYDIPKVALLDGKGQERDEGYFFKYPEHMGPGIYDGTPPNIPDVIGYATYDCGDWNLPNTPKFLKVTPPHRFVVKPTPVMKANAYYLRQCAALFRTSDPDRCSQLEDIAKWLDGCEKMTYYEDQKLHDEKCEHCEHHGASGDGGKMSNENRETIADIVAQLRLPRTSRTPTLPETS